MSLLSVTFIQQWCMVQWIVPSNETTEACVKFQPCRVWYSLQCPLKVVYPLGAITWPSRQVRACWNKRKRVCFRLRRLRPRQYVLIYIGLEIQKILKLILTSPFLGITRTLYIQVNACSFSLCTCSDFFVEEKSVLFPYQRDLSRCCSNLPGALWDARRQKNIGYWWLSWGWWWWSSWGCSGGRWLVWLCSDIHGVGCRLRWNDW